VCVGLVGGLGERVEPAKLYSVVEVRVAWMKGYHLMAKGPVGEEVPPLTGKNMSPVESTLRCFIQYSVLYLPCTIQCTIQCIAQASALHGTLQTVSQHCTALHCTALHSLHCPHLIYRQVLLSVASCRRLLELGMEENIWL
jgi:hypothetical protein